MNVKLSTMAYGTNLALGKGSLGNRIDYATEQTKNAVGGGLKSAAAGTAVAGTTLVAMNSKTVNNVVDKLVDVVKNSDKFKELAPKAGEFLKDVADGIKSLPTSTKIIAGAGIALAGIVGHFIDTQTAFKAGQIDQKYTDKAQLQEILEQ